MNRRLRAATASASSRVRRKNDTHESTTDPDAKLYRKSNNAAAKLSYIGHALAENRHGLVVEADATKATSRAEREAALVLIERHDPGSQRRLSSVRTRGMTRPALLPSAGA